MDNNLTLDNKKKKFAKIKRHLLKRFGQQEYDKL